MESSSCSRAEYTCAVQKEELVCGMALGYADPEQIVNRFITPRVPVEDFAVLLNND